MRTPYGDVGGFGESTGRRRGIVGGVEPGKADRCREFGTGVSGGGAASSGGGARWRSWVDRPGCRAPGQFGRDGKVRKGRERGRFHGRGKDFAAGGSGTVS